MTPAVALRTHTELSTGSMLLDCFSSVLTVIDENWIKPDVFDVWNQNFVSEQQQLNGCLS